MDSQFVDHIMIGLIAIMLIAIAVILFYNRLWLSREKKENADNKNKTNRLAIILQTGRLRLWIYKVSKRRYVSITETGDYTYEYNPIDFALFFDRDDFERLRSIIFEIREGIRESGTIRIKGIPEADGSQKQYEVMLSIVERDDKGRAKTLLGVQRDITDILRREQEVSQLLMRYHTVFNSALSDMLYYDKDGYLSDINDKALETFNITDRQELIHSRQQLKDDLLFGSIDFKDTDVIRTTAIAEKDYLERNESRLKLLEDSDKFYYEASINSVTNQNGELEGTYISGCNVSEMVESFHRQEAGVKQLRKVHKNIQKYIHNINYALRVSGVRLVSYYPDSFTFEITNNINQTQLTMSQVRCIRLASPRFRKDVSIALNRLDHRVPKPIDLTIEIILHDQKGRPIWLMFNMIPLFNDKGKVERYFGMCRNMTDMVETERRLSVETRKAQETETLKQSFLTNMSYEIRTPLNTVVGFAELFEIDHDPADETVFVDEIKKNSNQLLELVNDILFLSRLDADMIESNVTETDFALVFDSCCLVGLNNAKPGVKTIIQNDYEHLVVYIDIDLVNKVIQRECLIAAAFTSQGTIHCKYEYWHGELILTFEDTGTGFDNNLETTIYERLEHNSKLTDYGTDLDLPIIQAMVHKLGGKIEIQSEKNKGTTARITIPCKASLIEKKREEK